VITLPHAIGLSILSLVALERIAELIFSQRNQRRLLAEGAREVGASHYPLIVALHAAWLASLAFWVTRGVVVFHPIPFAAFLALQPLRLWIIASLGRFWTTRVITLPAVPLVKRGPYRLMRHPNYALVVAEIALLPLAFGAWQLSLVFSLCNAAVLAIRIRVEEAALAERQGSVANARRATS
jgi:methyltransferase